MKFSLTHISSLFQSIKRIISVWIILIALLNVAAAQIPGYIDAKMLIELEVNSTCDGEAEDEREVKQELDKDDYTLPSFPIHNLKDWPDSGRPCLYVNWQIIHSEIYTPPPEI